MMQLLGLDLFSKMGSSQSHNARLIGVFVWLVKTTSLKFIFRLSAEGSFGFTAEN